jgi:hypothetical protein
MNRSLPEGCNLKDVEGYPRSRESISRELGEPDDWRDRISQPHHFVDEDFRDDHWKAERAAHLVELDRIMVIVKQQYS